MRSGVVRQDAPRIERNRNGHYVFDGFVNGVAVEFLLDTGATDVSVPERIASRLRLQRGARLRAVPAWGWAILVLGLLGIGLLVLGVL